MILKFNITRQAIPVNLSDLLTFLKATIRAAQNIIQGKSIFSPHKQPRHVLLFIYYLSMQSKKAENQSVKYFSLGA